MTQIPENQHQAPIVPRPPTLTPFAAEQSQTDESKLLVSESYLKNLELIQAIINRMAANSFYLKGWSVTLVAGIFMVAPKDSRCEFILIGLIPTIVFGMLDAYFLNKEQQFRKLFDDARQMQVPLFDYRLTKYKQHFVGRLLNPTIWGVHGVLAAIVYLVYRYVGGLTQ